MKSHLLIYFLLLIFAKIPKNSLQDAFENVQRMTAEFSAMSGPTGDVMETVGIISKKNAEFLELTIKVASFIAAGLKIDFQPESNEYKAFTLLHSKMKEQFTDTFESRKQLRPSFSYGKSIPDYANIVNHHLDILKRLFLKVIHPDFATRKRWKDDFVSACNDHRISPINTLGVSFWEGKEQIYFGNVHFRKLPGFGPNEKISWMNDRLNEWCPMPQKEEAQIYALLVDFFYDIESRVERDHYSWRHSYNALKFDIIADLTTKSIQIAKQQISEMRSVVLPYLNTTFWNSEELYRKLMEATKFTYVIFYRNSFVCFLKTVIEGIHYRRDALFNFVDFSRRDYMQLEMILGVCANLSANGDEGKINEIMDEANQIVVQMSNKINVWVEQKLELAWPEVILSFAKTAYPKDAPKIDKYRYNQTAEHAWHRVNARGPNKYIHNVLITPADWDTQEYFWTPCATSYVCMKAQFKGTNLMITRHSKMDIDRAQRTKNWFDYVQSNITSIIATNWKTDSLPNLINQINDKTDFAIGNPSMFTNFVFLRNSILTRTEENCPIDFGIAYDWVHRIRELRPIQTIEYWGWPCKFCVTQNLEHFKLFLIL